MEKSCEKQGETLMNIQGQEQERMLTYGRKRGMQNQNYENDRQSEQWSEKRQKGLNKENGHHKMQVDVASLEWS